MFSFRNLSVILSLAALATSSTSALSIATAAPSTTSPAEYCCQLADMVTLDQATGNVEDLCGVQRAQINASWCLLSNPSDQLVQLANNVGQTCSLWFAGNAPAAVTCLQTGDCGLTNMPNPIANTTGLGCAVASATSAVLAPVASATDASAAAIPTDFPAAAALPATLPAAVVSNVDTATPAGRMGLTVSTPAEQPDYMDLTRGRVGLPLV